MILIPRSLCVLLGAFVMMVSTAGQSASSETRKCSQVDVCKRAVAWQKKQAAADLRRERMKRFRAEAANMHDVTRDAIHWAAMKYGGSGWARLERQMLGLGICESRLWPWAQNGQYLSWAQLSSRHRSDPVIARLTWRDPYAVADHVARYLLRHGEGEWQCRSSGGLRW